MAKRIEFALQDELVTPVIILKTFLLNYPRRHELDKDDLDGEGVKTSHFTARDRNKLHIIPP